VPTRRILGMRVATVNNVIEACDDPAYHHEHAAALGVPVGFYGDAPEVLHDLTAIRLLHKPRCLWRRYLCRNPRSIALFVLQLTGRGRAAVPARLGMS
jgi:hypothetical protein